MCCFIVTWLNLMMKTDKLLSNKKANPFESITRKSVEKAFSNRNDKNESRIRKRNRSEKSEKVKFSKK